MRGKPLFNSAKLGWEHLSRGVQTELKHKAKGLKRLLKENPELSPQAFKSWRLSDPPTTQDKLSVALGLSQTFLSGYEHKGLKDASLKTLRSRLEELLGILTEEPKVVVYVDPETGFTPEEQLSHCFQEFRGLLNKCRPLMGSGVLDQRFVDLLLKVDQMVEQIYPEAVQLGRMAQDRKNA